MTSGREPETGGTTCGPTRPRCRAPDACIAARPTTHCRRCTALWLRSNPEIEARRRAAVDAYVARPEVKAALAARIRRGQAAALRDPAKRERMIEHGRRQYRDHLSRPDVRARNQAADVRRRAGERITDTRLAGIPVEHRDEYRRLIREKGLTAAEARACVLDLVEAPVREARRAIGAVEQRQRERRRREKAEAY